MKDIDNVLGAKYLNAVDPLTAGLESVGKVADLGGKVVTSVTKPDLGKFVAQRCGRKTFGYAFSKSKRDDFKKCAQNATDDWNKQYNTTATTIMSGGTDTTKSLGNDQALSNTNKILIGLGIVVVGLVAYMVYKK
jgi:hypothetical protein